MGRWTNALHGKPQKKVGKKKLKIVEFSEKERSGFDHGVSKLPEFNDLKHGEGSNFFSEGTEKARKSVKTAPEAIPETVERCKVLVNALNGIKAKSGTVLQSSDSVHFSEISKFEEISLKERSQAGCDLWRFAFVGGSSRAIIARCGGIEACMQILDGNAQLASDYSLNEVQQLLSGALAILRCLCDDTELLSRIIQRGLTGKILSILYDRQQSALWAISLQILTVVAQHDRAERSEMLKMDILSKLLGDRGVRGGYSMLQDGREKFAIPALQFIEKILIKDSIRTQIVERTNCVELLCQIFESSNLDTQGVACRIISRLCQCRRCKKALRQADLHWFVAHFFGFAFSPINIGAAGVALGVVANTDDIEVALEFIPRACKMLTGIMDGSAKQSWEFNNLALPGTLRAVRTFAELAEIQRKLTQYIPALNCIMAKEESSEISKADAAFILGSISLQPTNQRALLSLIPNPLVAIFRMIRGGSTEAQASAARTILILSSNPEIRRHIASYTYRERVLVNKSTLEEAHTTWDALDAACGLLEKKQTSENKCYGAGIIQNFAGLEEICEKIKQRSKNDPSTFRDLADICSSESSLQARVYAASALGNMCKDQEIALTIYKAGVIRCIAALLHDNEHKDPGSQTTSNVECQEACIWTLGRLAYSGDAVAEMVEYKVLDTIVQLLVSRSRISREIGASALRNMACFPGCQTFVLHATLLQTVFSILLNSAEDDVVSEHLIATIANLGLNKSNIPFLITCTSCSGFVSIAQERNTAHKHHVALIMRCAASTLDAKIQKLLVDAGGMPVLVHMLREGIDVAGGPAVNSAGAIARLAACDHKYCALCVENHGIDSLLILLSDGCKEAQIQAAKSLIILTEDRDYCDLVKQQGGLGLARRAVEYAQNDDLIKLLNILIGLLFAAPAHEAKATSMIEKQIIAKHAVLKAKAELIRNQNENLGYTKDRVAGLVLNSSTSCYERSLPKHCGQLEAGLPRLPGIKPVIQSRDHGNSRHTDPVVQGKRVTLGSS